MARAIAHIGVGNFHRSHQAMYVDALLRAGGDPRWTIRGIGMLASDAAVRDAMRANGWRYTLTLRHADGTQRAQEITAITDIVLATEDRAAALAVLTDPAVRVVTMTITEGGYDPPSPAFELLVDALVVRRAAGVEPFTLVSCDNVPHNGAIARAALLSVAGDLAPWIAANVACPSSMVDRITPATDDPVHVFAEPFVQWVLEDAFPTGRPEFARVGVQLVGDVAPYETMKLRLLNGAHQALAYDGLARGHVYVHEAVADPFMVDLLARYWAEAIPTVPPVPGIDLDAYVNTLLERFANRFVADTLARLAEHSEDRMPKFVLPVLEDNRRAGRSTEACEQVVASWRQYLCGGPPNG